MAEYSEARAYREARSAVEGSFIAVGRRVY
jgi:hypothetical protein